MAVLRAGNPAMPNDIDDRTDTSPGFNIADSGYKAITAYLYVPGATYAFAHPGYVIDLGDFDESDVPSEQAGVWGWIGS